MDEGHGSVTVEFEFTREEMLPVLRWQTAQQRQIRFLRIFAVVVAVAGSVVLAGAAIAGVGALVVAGAVAVGYGLVELGLIAWVLARTPDRAWRRAYSDAGPRTVSFSEEGVLIRTRDSSSTNSWNLYSETHLRDDMYLMRLARLKTLRAYMPVPKRAFKSLADEQAFRLLASTHTKAEF